MIKTETEIFYVVQYLSKKKGWGWRDEELFSTEDKADEFLQFCHKESNAPDSYRLVKRVVTTIISEYEGFL